MHTHRVALELCPGPENLNPYTRGFRCCTLIIIEEEFQFHVGKLTVEGCCDFKMQSRCRVCFVWLRCITTYFSADLCVHVEPAAVDVYSQSHVRVFAAVHYLLMCSHALPVRAQCRAPSYTVLHTHGVHMGCLRLMVLSVLTSHG